MSTSITQKWRKAVSIICVMAMGFVSSSVNAGPCPSATDEPTDLGCKNTKICTCQDNTTRNLSCEYPGRGSTSRAHWKLDSACPK